MHALPGTAVQLLHWLDYTADCGRASSCAPVVLLQGKSREVEQTRLEVDSRRRTVQELARQVDEARGRLGGSNADKAQAQLEALEQKLQHKQEKLSGED